MTAAEGKGEHRRMRTIEQQDLTGTTHVVPLWSLLSRPIPIWNHSGSGPIDAPVGGCGADGGGGL